MALIELLSFVRKETDNQDLETYILVFDDGMNLSPAITVSMGEPDELQVHLSQTSISCHGDDDGKLNTAVVGGIHASDGDFSSSSVENTNFGCLGYSLQEPHASPAERSRYHIHLEDVANFTIGSAGNPNNFSGADNGVFGRFCHQITLEDNNFDDFTVNTNTSLLRTGIAALFEGFDPISLPQDASLRMIGGLIIFDSNEFTDCEGGIAVYNEGFNAHDNTMTNVKFCILGQRPNSLTFVSIKDNHLFDTQIGIDLRAIGWTQVMIEGNEISVIAPPSGQITSGIRVVEPTRSVSLITGNLIIQNNPEINLLGTHGIFLLNVQRARVSGNIINMNHDPASNPVYGIRIENGNKNVLCGNEVKGAVSLDINNKSAISIEGSPRTSIECDNVTDYTETGLELSETCDNSRIRVNQFNNHDYGIVLSNNGIIGPQTDFDAPNTYPANAFIGDGSGTFGQYALESRSSYAGINDFWIGNSGFFIPNGNNLTGIGSSFSTNYIPGYSEYSCPSTCDDVVFPELIDMDFADKVVADSISFTSNEDLMKWKLKYSLFDQLSRDTSSFTLLHFSDFMDSVAYTNLIEFYNTSELINLTNDSTYFTDSTAVHTLLDAALSINDGITTSIDFESYLQYVNSIYFLLVSTYNYQLSNEEYELVINIANRCPYEDGPAVYCARAILAMQDDRTFFDDSELCVEESRFSSANTYALDHLLIYPIPANNELNIKTFKDVIKFVEIFDNLGQLVNTLINYQHSTQMNISLQSYPPGIYQIKVKVSSGKLYNEKFVIIK